jgi:hypothetical protein
MITRNEIGIPKTIAYIKGVIETNVQIALRRIEWAKNEYLRCGKGATKSAFVRFAGIEHMAGTAIVAEAVQTALQIINSSSVGGGNSRR